MKFKIGIAYGVVFDLASKEDDSCTYEGKVSINTPGLSCSNLLAFDKSDLIEFHKAAAEIYSTLTGSASITSKCLSFDLLISGVTEGHMKIEVSLSRLNEASPENCEWKTTVCFHDYADALAQLMECKSEIIG